MGNLSNNDTMHQVFASFTEHFPEHAGKNKALGKAATAYSDLYKRRAEAETSANEARLRLPQVDLLVGDGITPKERTQLLEERAVLASLLAGYPTRAGDLARKCATAHLQYLALLRSLACSEVDAAQKGLEVINAEARTVRRALHEDDSTQVRQNAWPPEVEAPLLARLSELRAAAAPLQQRIEWAWQVANVAEARADNDYADQGKRNFEGPDVLLGSPGTWPPAIERVARAAYDRACKGNAAQGVPGGAGLSYAGTIF
jgi:hypothetical protein